MDIHAFVLDEATSAFPGTIKKTTTVLSESPNREQVAVVWIVEVNRRVGVSNMFL